jgi:hypothetical protein
MLHVQIFTAFYSLYILGTITVGIMYGAWVNKSAKIHYGIVCEIQLRMRAKAVEAAARLSALSYRLPTDDVIGTIGSSTAWHKLTAELDQLRAGEQLLVGVLASIQSQDDLNPITFLGMRASMVLLQSMALSTVSAAGFALNLITQPKSTL